MANNQQISRNITAILNYVTWCQRNWEYYFEQMGLTYRPLTLCVQDLAIAECCEGIKDMKSTIAQYLREVKTDYKKFTDVVESVRHLSFWYAQKEIHYSDGTRKPNDHYSREFGEFCSDEYYRLKQLFYDTFADNEEAQQYFFDVDD